MPDLPATLKPKTTAELCADTLRRSVLRGDYPPGSRLPPERELATALGVNRMTLRAALQRLGQEGLLITRQGSGHTVRDAFDVGGPDLVPAILEVMADPHSRHTAFADLLATRRALARLVLTRAAAALDAVPPPQRPAALAPLIEAVDALEALAQGADQRPKSNRSTPSQITALSVADRKIVAALLRLTGSATLPLFLNPIAALIDSLPELSATLYAEPHGNVRGWRAAITWLTHTPRTSPALLEDLMSARDADTLARLATASPKPTTRARRTA